MMIWCLLIALEESRIKVSSRNHQATEDSFTSSLWRAARAEGKCTTAGRSRKSTH